MERKHRALLLALPTVLTLLFFFVAPMVYFPHHFLQFMRPSEKCFVGNA